MSYSTYCILHLFRGDNFRKMFAEIGTIRIRKDLALTATATHETVKSIFERLSMTEASIIGLSRERPNIKYSVIPMCSMADLCSALAQELTDMRAETCKTVCFAKLCSSVGIFSSE